MRIVLVNWAPIAEGARRGGGVNGYCHGLALELVERGHEVVSLSSGARFDGGGGGGGGLRIETSSWGRVGVREIVNSPVLAPSLAQFKEPMGEVSAPALESLVEAEIARLAPDVVHFHNIEGLSAGCVGAVRRGWPAAKIVFSLHNYHTICPQVYLLQGHRRPCFSFDQGHACEGCIPAPDPAAERRRLAEGPRAAPEPAPAPVSPPTKGVLDRWFKRGEPELPPRFVPGRGPHPWYGDDVPAWRPLLNVIQPEPAGARPPNDYARRRDAMIAMLNQCDTVLAVSDFVGRKFAAMGVGADRIRVMHIGSRMTELAGAARAGSQRQPLTAAGRRQRPINLAFMGYNNWYKGLPMLADALDLLTPEVLACFHLHVYALEGQQMEPIFRTIEPRLGGLTLRHGYRYEEIPALLSGIDLGVVPSVWWDNAPQTVMEFFACGVPVLAARLGGIPDFVEEGRNGLLFVGNHRWDLARRLAEIALDPAVVERLRAGVHPPKTMGEHAAELERMYGRAIS